MRAAGLSVMRAGAFAAALAWGAVGASAQETLWVDEAVANAIAQAKGARDLSGWGVVTRGPCLLGGTLAASGEISIKYPVRAGHDYLFVAAGDADVVDLDMNIASDDGEIDEDDIEDDATPWVLISPESDGKVTVTLDLAETNGADFAFCVLIVLESGNEDGSLKRLQATVTGLTEVIRHTRDAVRAASDGEADIAVDATPGQWSLIGGLFADDAKQTLTRPFERGVQYVTVGWADANARDLDLKVSLKSDRDEVIAHDVEEDTTPVVDFQLRKRQDLALTLHMFGAKKPAFGAAVVLVGSSDD